MPTSIPRVRPGDLITADLMNTMIDRLNALEAAVAAGEGTPTAHAVSISGLIPANGNVRVGDFLQVFGQNFDFSIGAQRVFIDTTRVDAFDGANCSDTKLVFRIPSTITDVPSGGRPAILTVNNATSTARWTITLLPALELVGAIDVNPMPPPQIVPSTQVTFQYELVCNATLATTYDLTATLTPAANPDAWRGQVHILDTNQATEINQLRLVPNQRKTIFVRINQVPAGTNLVSFDLVLDVKSTAGNVGGSSLKTYVVGGPAEEIDETTKVNVPSIEVLPGSSGAVTSSTVTVGAGTVNLSYPVIFEVQGNYDLDVVFSNGATNWSVAFMGLGVPPRQTHATIRISDTDLANPQHTAPKNIAFSLRRDAGATAGRIQLKIQRQGQARFAEKTMQLLIG